MHNISNKQNPLRRWLNTGKLIYGNYFSAIFFRTSATLSLSAGKASLASRPVTKTLCVLFGNKPHIDQPIQK